MYLERNCKICGEPFVAIKQTQLFCQRRCFKKDYYRRTKGRILELRNRRASYHCPHCFGMSSLLFDPSINEDAFRGYVCPWCGIPRQVLYDHQWDYTFVLGNSATARFVVSSAIVSGFSPPIPA